MKRFICTEQTLKVINDETGDLVVMTQGDALTLPAAQVDAMCSYGWGTSDGVETGERVPGVKVITPAPSQA